MSHLKNTLKFMTTLFDLGLKPNARDGNSLISASFLLRLRRFRTDGLGIQSIAITNLQELFRREADISEVYSDTSSSGWLVMVLSNLEVPFPNSAFTSIPDEFQLFLECGFDPMTVVPNHANKMIWALLLRAISRSIDDSWVQDDYLTDNLFQISKHKMYQRILLFRLDYGADPNVQVLDQILI